MQHVGEIAIAPELVRSLLAAQFPHWAFLPLKRVVSGGTSNALFRLGDALVVRLPLIASAAGDVEREARTLPLLAPHLPLPVPSPVAVGAPGAGYPFAWTVSPWLEGTDALVAPPPNLVAAAETMAAFIEALQGILTINGPPPGSGRGGPLHPRDAEVQRALPQLSGDIDTDALSRIWADALAAPDYAGPPVWLHADLHPANLLVRDGRVSAVLDWGTLTVGDPAVEMILAWTLLDAPARKLLRDRLQIDDATWRRGRGWALSMAAIAWPYYRHTNPTLVAISRRALTELLADACP